MIKYILHQFKESLFLGCRKVNKNGEYVSGFKNVFDVVKDIIAIGTLLFVSASVLLRKFTLPEFFPNDCLVYMSLLSSSIFAIMLVILLFQLIYCISILPLFNPLSRNFFIRLFFAMCFLTYTSGIIFGLALSIIVAIQQLI